MATFLGVARTATRTARALGVKAGSCLVIFGCRSTALEVAGVARALYPDRQVYLVHAADEVSCGPEVLSEAELERMVREHPGPHGYLAPMSRRVYRERWIETANALGLMAESIIHPRAVVARSAEVASGTYLAAQAVLSENVRLEGPCVVNYNAVIGHDARLEAHVIVNPGVSVGGGAVIGRGTLLGANAFVAQGKTVGPHCVVDALTYVYRDLPAGTVFSSRRRETAASENPGDDVPERKVHPAVGEGVRERLLDLINRVRSHDGCDPLAALKADHRLREDLKLDSLALAELAVRVEAAFGKDVFADGMLGTVGDVENRLR